MNNQVLDYHGLKSLGLQDDLLVLSEIYSYPQLIYVDVSTQDVVKEIMDHWAILREFSDMDSKDN